MKKLVAVLSLSTLIFVGCDAHAQSDGTVVGNPDSSNAVIIQQGYEVIATVPAAPTQPVAVQNSENSMAPAMPNPNSGVAVIESVSDVETPNSMDIEYNKAIVPYNP